MSIHYCRLRLSVQEPLKVTDLFYRFVVTNNKTKKSTKFEGYFDAQGLTQWTEIHNMDTTLEYIVFFRSTLIQRISVVAYPNKTIQNNFTLKTTTEMTKIMNENIFEMYLDDGQVGWYFVKKTETMLDWSKRIFKQMLVPSDWEVLRTNNPHIDHIQPIRLLTPGMIVVLSNSTKAKQLPQYKNDAQQAQKNLDEMKKDKSFDAEFFALNYEFFYDSLKYEEFVGISTTPINDVDGKGSAVGSTVKNTVDGALVFVAEVKNRTLNSYAKITENYMVEHKNKTRLANSKHFDKFVSANANLFRDFDNNIAKKCSFGTQELT